MEGTPVQVQQRRYKETVLEEGFGLQQDGHTNR